MSVSKYIAPERGPHEVKHVASGRTAPCGGLGACRLCDTESENYGRHDHTHLVRTYGWCFKAGLSPMMCEARHHDWSWAGQHRAKGWPWELTVDFFD